MLVNIIKSKMNWFSCIISASDTIKNSIVRTTRNVIRKSLSFHGLDPVNVKDKAV